MLKLDSETDNIEELLKLLEVKNNTQKVLNLYEFKLILEDQINKLHTDTKEDICLKFIKSLAQENLR